MARPISPSTVACLRLVVACATLAAGAPWALASEGTTSGAGRLTETWRSARASGNGATPLSAPEIAATEAMVKSWVDRAVTATLGMEVAPNDATSAGAQVPGAIILVTSATQSPSDLPNGQAYSQAATTSDGQPLTDFQLMCLVVAGFTLVALVTTVLQWRIDRLDAQQGSSLLLPRRTSIG